MTDSKQNGAGAASEKDICSRTFKFALRIIRLCQYLDRKPGTPRRIAGQLLDSGTSIGSNIEEAQAGQSRADFIHKASISLKESRETCYWLRLITAAQLVPASKLQNLLQEATEISLILGSIVARTKKNSAQINRSKGQTRTDARL